MKIIKFTAENIKRLKAVEITPTGNIVKITGKNKAGKSSVLDAIEMALKGKFAASRSALRKETQKGKVVLDLGDFTVTRSFTEGSNYLKVETKDGFERKSPQKFLDDIVGAVSFDPLNFINADSKRQRELLLDFSGLKLDELDERRKEFYEARTIESRYLRDAEGRLKSIEQFPDAPEKPVQVTELLKELDSAKRYNAKEVELGDALCQLEDDEETTKETIARDKADIADMEKALKTLKDQLISEEATLGTMAKDITKAKTAVDNFKRKPEKEIKGRIGNVEVINNQVRANLDHAKADDEVKKNRKRVNFLTTRIDGIDREKTEAVENSKLPIKGLSFSDDAVLYNGIELEHIAQSEKIRVGLEISMALNPKLKVLRITDGSLLDSTSWKLITALVKKNDYQVWVEQVDESGKVGFYLEDGSIVEKGNK